MLTSDVTSVTEKDIVPITALTTRVWGEKIKGKVSLKEHVITAVKLAIIRPIAGCYREINIRNQNLGKEEMAIMRAQTLKFA